MFSQILSHGNSKNEIRQRKCCVFSTPVANYRPISITSVLSKVFERLVSVRLGRFMERSGVLPNTQFAYQKGLGTCDALLCLSHTLQSALESGQEARIV